ncbi:keratin, type II cytoskeletal 2 epidermal-like [Anopheles stephensi]|uniref:keratin, type II cytoskeletal 2 epidermal-like n=1 Tax=Anopheles stephensi TaxID=30069 RepID=UPI001658719C|nr:keratin, type II cytoskeletal 2 epidermal-like [Anopheles stephensi]
MKLIVTVLSIIGLTMVFARPPHHHSGGGSFNNGTGPSYNHSGPSNNSANVPRFGFNQLPSFPGFGNGQQFAQPSGIPFFGQNGNGNGQGQGGFPSFGGGPQNGGGFPFIPGNGQQGGNNQQGGNFPFFT